jgi:MOSC domain-containing protein YiiM
MKISSLHVGLPQRITWQGNEVLTSIFKTRVDGTLKVEKTNLEGDRPSDLSVHGGPDKAVYAYSLDVYDWWRKELKLSTLAEGSFGENLTVSGLDESQLCLGDRLRVGTAELEVCQPRLPCFKLGIRFNDMGILKTFMKSGRPGIYFRVWKEGQLSVGDDLQMIFEEPQRVPLVSLFLWKRNKGVDKALAEKALKVQGLDADWREAVEGYLRD